MKAIDSAKSTGRVRQVRMFTNVVSPPVIYIILGYAVALSQLPTAGGFLWGTLYAFLVALLPLLYVVWLLYTERIQDINMTRQQRSIPYLVAVISAAVMGAIVWFGDGPRYLFHLTLLNVIALGGMGLINLRMQISNHATAIASAMWVAAFVFDKWIGVMMLPVVVVVCAARLYLKRHTPSQIAAGLTLGTVAVMALLLTGCFSG
ncbi:MAG: hypothetical protein ACPG8W_05695 [Candidatus Promineifilaceae bacterium]